MDYLSSIQCLLSLYLSIVVQFLAQLHGLGAAFVNFPGLFDDVSFHAVAACLVDFEARTLFLQAFRLGLIGLDWGG